MMEASEEPQPADFQVSTVSNSKKTRTHFARDHVLKEPADTSCGIFGWRPSCLQRFATPNSFFALVCACLMVEVAAHTGYVGGVLSTIEKDFQLSSSEVAFVTVVNHIGAFTSIVTSYIGSKTHRPRFIALAVAIIGIGQFVCGLTHFIANSDTTFHALSSGSSSSASSYKHNSSSLICGASSHDQALDGSGCTSSGESNLSKAWLLIVGELITGIGSGPVIPLMITYIDDCVGKEKVSVYVGILFACAGSGPVIGWLLSGLTLRYHVDFDRYAIDSRITASDPGWIGAWWLGFLILGPIMMVLAPFICLFPKEMSNQQSKEDIGNNLDDISNSNVSPQTQTASSDLDYAPPVSQALFGYFSALKRLLTNIPFIGVSFSTTGIVIAGLGQFYFGAKYLETQYGLTTWLAPIILGAMVLPATLGGVLLGGYLVKRWNLTKPPQRCARMSGTLGILSTLFWFILLFVGCGHNTHLAGLKMPYPLDKGAGYALVDHKDVTLLNECNVRCGCSEEDLNPVCSYDGITFASPCFAGCDTAVNDTVFSNCSCIPSLSKSGGGVNPSDRIATLGHCVDICWTVIPYGIIYACGAFALALSQNPNYMLTLRSVDQHDRAIGLGLSNVVMRLLGNLLGPIYFGAAIDTSCILRETSQCGRQGACVLYDLKKYRTIFIGMLFGFVAIHTLCVWVAYYSLSVQRGRNQRRHVPLEPEERSSAKAFAGNKDQDSKNDKMFPL